MQYIGYRQSKTAVSAKKDLIGRVLFMTVFTGVCL